MIGVFPAGVATEVAARHSKYVCVTDMAATRLETVPRQNLPIIPIVGCFVKSMQASIIAVMTILKG